MSLLQKRRSRSESRKVDSGSHDRAIFAQNMLDAQIFKLKNDQCQSRQNINNLGQQLESITTGTMGRRKTSAELISEAKNYLGNAAPISGMAANQAASMGGVRLVSTRRPVTPREPGRALYGKVALAGRPPSSFSLRYLQSEGKRLPKTPPSLEPIKNIGANVAMQATECEHLPMRRTSRRSNSFDSSLQSGEIGTKAGALDSGVSSNKMCGGTQPKTYQRKLPSLEIKGVALEVKGKENGTDMPAKYQTSTEEDHSLDTNASINNNSAINRLASRKLLTRNCDLLAQSTTEKLIELLKEHAGLKDCNDETVKHINSILLEIYGRVRKNERNFKRGFILGGLYGLVECSSPTILLAVAKVVFALRVTGSNLTGACKLVFKVARNEQNDHLFHDNDILELLIDGLGRASPLDDPEACIYGYGSIRFLTSSNGQERAEASSTATKDVNKNWSERLELPKKPSTAPAAGSHKNALDALGQERVQKLNKQNTLVERLARHGAVELMVLHLQILNETGATQKLSGPPLHSLYQLSAALRALADVRQISSSIEQDLELEQKQLKICNIQLELACPHLIRAAEVSIGELEVQANIVRTLSVLSEDNDCCNVLLNFTPRIGILLGPCCEIFSGSSEKLLSLFSRLGYILGNIMAKYDTARVQFYHNDAAMEYLLRVLELYSKEPLNIHNSLGDTVIDVLIKMIRVVANMSVNSEVGFGLGNTRALGAILLNLLNVTSTQMKTAKMKSELQELLHATLGALHNLCFYQDKNTTPTQVMESKGSIQSILPDLATALSTALRSCKDEATQMETARVLGNLTRNEQARKYFCRADGLRLMVQQLCQNPQQQHYDLKACSIGVLVNLLGDWENRAPFVHLKGAEMLAELLKCALQQEDWFMGTIISQAFWNLLIDAPRVADVCQECVLEDLCDLLADFLDEERLFEGCTGTDARWEDFAVVATDLLERIQNNYEKQGEDKEYSDETSDNENEDEEDVYIEEM